MNVAVGGLFQYNRPLLVNVAVGGLFQYNRRLLVNGAVGGLFQYNGRLLVNGASPPCALSLCCAPVSKHSRCTLS
jgi:hypothetical protein